MIVAGIDGSTTCSGVAIMQDGELLFHTAIDYHKEQDTMKRVMMMQTSICEVLNKYKVNSVCMEKAFTKSNVKTTMVLANLAGGIMLYCAQNEIDFSHPLPSEWRSKVGVEQSNKIKREVLKAEAIASVKKEYGLEVGDDEAEAILMARSMFNLPKLDITEDELWESV